MDRLTFRTNLGAGILNGSESIMPSDIYNNYTPRAKTIIEALDRLAEYEDTGLTPAEIIGRLKGCDDVGRKG